MCDQGIAEFCLVNFSWSDRPHISLWWILTSAWVSYRICSCCQLMSFRLYQLRCMWSFTYIGLWQVELLHNTLFPLPKLWNKQIDR